MIGRNFKLLLLAVLSFGLIASCTPFLLGPSDPNSSLIIGRIVLDSKYSGAFYGLLPTGVLDKGLEIEVETRDGKEYFKVTTEEQGYFLIPNLPSNAYHVLGVIIEAVGAAAIRKDMRYDCVGLYSHLHREKLPISARCLWTFLTEGKVR